jgi:hypothetical protein
VVYCLWFMVYGLWFMVGLGVRGLVRLVWFRVVWDSLGLFRMV